MTDTMTETATGGAKGARACEVVYRITDADLTDPTKVLALMQATAPMIAEELAAVVSGRKSKGGEFSCHVGGGSGGWSGGCSVGVRF